MLFPRSKVALAFLLLTGYRSSGTGSSNAFILPACTTRRITNNNDAGGQSSSLTLDDSFSSASRRIHPTSYRLPTTLHYLHRPDADTSQDFYMILGVPRDATETDIKSAFRRLAKLYHPDANLDRDTTEQFQMLNRAYEVLRDPKLKKAYDVFGSKGIGTSAASDMDNLKREQARRQRRPTAPNPSSPGSRTNYYTGNADFGSGWPSGTKNTSPFSNTNNPYASTSRTTASTSSGAAPPRTPSGNTVGSRPSSASGSTRAAPSGTNAPYNPANHDTFRVDKSIFESTARSRTRPSPPGTSSSSQQRVRTSSSSSVGQDYQTGPKANDSTAYYGDMGTVHGQSGNGYSDNSRYVPNDGVAFTSGEAFFGRGPKFGRDVLIDVEIDVKTANSGGTKWIEVKHMEKCTACKGIGTKDPTRSKVSNCPHCGGTGHTMSESQKRETCSACLGTGRMISNPCDSCKGLGLETTTQSMQVVIPKQIDDGFTMRIPGQGDAGPNGGPSGDLYVCFSVPGLKKKKSVRTSTALEKKAVPKKTVVLNNNNNGANKSPSPPPRPKAASLDARTVVSPAPRTVVSPAPQTVVSNNAAKSKIGVQASATPPSTSPPPPPQNDKRKRTVLKRFFGGFVSKVMSK